MRDPRGSITGRPLAAAATQKKTQLRSLVFRFLDGHAPRQTAAQPSASRTTPRAARPFTSDRAIASSAPRQAIFLRDPNAQRRILLAKWKARANFRDWFQFSGGVSKLVR